MAARDGALGRILREKTMTDRYTKAVLTIIAACLVILVLRGQSVIPASAQGQVSHVYVDGGNLEVTCKSGCLPKLP